MEQGERILRLALRRKAITIFSVLLVVASIAWSSNVIKDHTDAWIGVIAALAVIPAEQLIDVIVQYRLFHRLEGIYSTHSYANESPAEACEALNLSKSELECVIKNYNADLTFSTKSTAVIEYLGDSYIKITLSENNPPKNNRWVGRCIMESEEVGIMSWTYENLGDNPEPWERNGVKRLSVVSADTSPIKLSLFTYGDNRFGRELLIKNELGEDLMWPPNWLANVCWIVAGLIVLTVRIFIT